MPSNSIILKLINLFARTGSSGGSVITMELVVRLGGGGFGFVDRRFWPICRRCPLTVALDFGRCFLTRSAVRPGQVVKKHALMACIQMDGTGLKAALWR